MYFCEVSLIKLFFKQIHSKSLLLLCLLQCLSNIFTGLMSTPYINCICFFDWKLKKYKNQKYQEKYQAKN